MSCPQSSYVFLNDEGVALLQRNCYRHAFAKFEAATLALRISYYPVGQKPNQKKNAKPAMSETSEPFPCPPRVQCSDIALTELASADQIFQLLQIDSQQDATIAIRLGAGCEQGVQINTASEDQTKRIASAIIAYNLAIARQTYARGLCNQRRNELCTVQLEEAARLFEMAHRALRTLSDDLFRSRQVELLHRILLVRMIALLGHHTQVVGTQAAKKVESRLTRVHCKISSLYRQSTTNMPADDQQQLASTSTVQQTPFTKSKAKVQPSQQFFFLSPAVRGKKKSLFNSPASLRRTPNTAGRGRSSKPPSTLYIVLH